MLALSGSALQKVTFWNGARIEWWCFTAGAFGVRVMEIGVGIYDGVEAKPKSRQLGGQRHGYGDAS